MALQANLARIRVEKGFRSQKALAEASGVSLRSIADYETGSAEPTLGVLVKLADALGCGLDDLAGRETPPPEVSVNGVRYERVVERAAEAALREAEAASDEADSLRPGEPPADRGENG